MRLNLLNLHQESKERDRDRQREEEKERKHKYVRWYIWNHTMELSIYSLIISSYFYISSSSYYSWDVAESLLLHHMAVYVCLIQNIVDGSCGILIPFWDFAFKSSSKPIFLFFALTSSVEPTSCTWIESTSFNWAD